MAADWLEEALAATKDLHENDKLFQAKKRLDEARARLDAEDRGATESAARRGRLDASPLVAEVDRRFVQVDRLLREFNEDGGWQTIRSSGGVETLYMAVESTGTHSFKVRGEIDVPPENAAALLFEVDLIKTWFPMTKVSREVACLSRFRKIALAEVTCLWPVSNRETLLEGYGVDAIEDLGLVIVHMHSVSEYPGIELPEPAPGCVRAEMSHGGFLIEPLSRDRTRFSMMVNVDPKLPVIPYSVLNWFTGKLVHVIHSRVQWMASTFVIRDAPLTDEEVAERKKKNKDFKGNESPFYLRTRENAEVYRYMVGKFRDHYERLEKSP